ncbi:polar amino acid transport system substrate-binding protein [Pseudoalteromonas ulvae UL12]|uniref:Solute-binding protein family 3/N-terminal domain-containing protein n=1 Tax=Pseudoalteromonas ulvae TaxID=107327 RepID=A0A2C9ZZH2_PSEDV|nr:transporter substrate-binding domain-containing protein [Pseudoalteromonas ulvae]MBE0364692.1 polar amino acid transport system substrate-binding protein [Pseudoalteromonas ulvae UL12]OUL56164.1 hypothetical protein B1199_18810 [Pseudoalteromonas ulvae]
MIKLVFWMCIGWLFFPAHATKPTLNFYTEISPPGNYLDESGILVGSSVEMIEELNRIASYRVKSHVFPWTRAYQKVLKRPNSAIFSISRTPQREDLFHWVGPLLRVKWVLYKHRDSQIEIANLDDAKQLTSIAATRNDAKADYLLSLGFKNLDLSEDNIGRMRKLYANHNDVILTSNLGVERLAELALQDPEHLEIALEVKSSDIYLAFNKETDQQIIDDYKRAFEVLQKSPIYYEILVKWYGEKATHEIFQSIGLKWAFTERTYH